jgi:hypothetical protein
MKSGLEEGGRRRRREVEGREGSRFKNEDV